MGKVTCQKVVLVLVLHSLIYVHGASTAIGRKTLADLEIRRELKRLNKPAIKTIKSVKLSFDKSLQGGEGVINIWNPRVEVPSESTKGTMFVGRRDSFDLVSSGWMVSPSLFGDAATRLYAFWGTDNNVGCYNLKCPGFVQTSHALTLGGALRVSSYGAEQIIIPVKIFRDQGNGNWWLAVENKTLGYWPSSLFKSMAKNADYIQWGGQIYNSVPGGKHTSTEMGSGLWPERGPRKAAYFRKCLYYDENISGKMPDYWYETKKLIIAPVKKELGLAFKGSQKMVVEALEAMSETEAMEMKGALESNGEVEFNVCTLGKAVKITKNMVNRIRELPQNNKIVATHTDSPDVLIWDVEAQPNRHAVLGTADSRPDLVENENGPMEYELGAPG
ncbi:hypothetical protein AAC387_Pa02g0953 [Persea americana]